MSRGVVCALASDERGGVLVLFGLLLPFFLLLGAMAVDVGNWYVHKRHLQTQADAAALAGGGVFGRCFSDPATGDAAVLAEATKFSGGPGSTYNAQVGGTLQGEISILYQSKTFAAGGPTDPDAVDKPPCTNLMLDVKATEAKLPLIFALPGLPWVERLNAHARVELKKATIVSGSLPLAVPEVRPKHVTATFVDEAGAIVGGPFDLSGPTAVSGLNAWSGSGAVTVAAGAKVGVRIGLGHVAGACGAANGTGGTGYVCYDYGSFSTGLASIAGYAAAGTPTVPARSSFEVSAVTACAGSPFFSDESLAGTATTCDAAVQAVVHVGSGTIDPAQVKTFTANVTGPGFNQSQPLTFGGGVWTTGYAFAIPVDGGPYDVSLTWQYEGGKKESYPDVQRIYSGAEDSGPVKALGLTGTGGGALAPYSLPAGSHTVTVDVLLEGNLHLSAPDEMVMLRLTGGSRTSAVACDGPGFDLFREAVIGGCETPYQINPVGYCPDPAPPAGPPDCVPTQTGEGAGPTLQGLDTRFAACPAYNWPTYEPDDPRIVKLMITDFSALGGSGTTDVPVTNFAAFYVAGWTGSKCATNAPPPFEVKKGAIWGHFVRYAAPDPDSAGSESCDPTALTPCIPVLTR